MVPGDGVEGPFFMVPGDAWFLLPNEVRLEKPVQGYLTSDSEFSSIVESRDHFLARDRID